jgi:hypothetical protein
MVILETFSKRQKRLANAGTQDIYTYDALPTQFRVQVIHIWNSALGRYYARSPLHVAGSPANKLWENLHDTLAREFGVFKLAHGLDPAERCQLHLMGADLSEALDAIEFACRIIDRLARQMHPYSREAAEITQTADDAISELNGRFPEHGLGYQYAEGDLIRLDSQFLHAETVKPALSLLGEQGFDGPAQEFLGAFEHYRHGRNKEAITDALKAFESTMKAICSARGWRRQENATAKPLLDIMSQNDLLPAELQSHFAAFRSAMESGLPTISNKMSRHGQGSVPVNVPPHVVAHALHLAAANIVLLVQAHKALR